MTTTARTRRDLEQRRRLAVQRVRDGYPQVEVARFLGVDPRSVRKWVAAHRHGGDSALNAKPHVGRHAKLNAQQTAVVLSWFRQSPTAFGYATDLWTARRVAEQIFKHFGVSFNSHYLSAWLTDRCITPQRPQRVPNERDPHRLDSWLRDDWPRILKKGPMKMPTSS